MEPAAYDPIAAGLAVQPGDTVDQGMEKDPVFPFFYGFVDPEDSDSVSGFLGSPLIAAGRQHTFYVKLDPDYAFKLIDVRYRALNFDGTRYYEAEQTSGLGLQEPDYQLEYRTYWYQFVDVSLWFSGSGSRILYGGQNLNPNIAQGLSPLPIVTMQGYFYGYAQAPTPYLLARNSVVVVQITNNHPTESLHVNGALRGVKVRV